MNKTSPGTAGATTAERSFSGIAVSPGVAIGPMFGAVEAPAEVVRARIHAADSAAETSRLEAAIAQSRKQLVKLRARLGVLPEDSQAEIAPRSLCSARLRRKATCMPP